MIRYSSSLFFDDVIIVLGIESSPSKAKSSKLESHSSRCRSNNSTNTMSESLALRGYLKGHTDWVTSLATNPEDPNLLLSCSRDKSVIVWHLTHSSDGEYGYARRALRGHSHFCSDVVISSDGAFALSASWDSELRLWDISSGKTTRRFVGHEKDVLSVAFSVDNRQIVSGTFVPICWIHFVGYIFSVRYLTALGVFVL